MTSLRADAQRLTGYRRAEISGIAGSKPHAAGEVFGDKVPVGGPGLAVTRKPKAGISM